MTRHWSGAPPAPSRLDKEYPACYSRARFRPCPGQGRIAQLVEQLTLNQRVPGSSPGAPTMAGQATGPAARGFFVFQIRRAMKRALANILLVSASILVCSMVAELVVRDIDGYSLRAWPLPPVLLPFPTGSRDVPPDQLDHVQRAVGVKREWFFDDPPALPNRHPPPDEWLKFYERLNRNSAALSAGDFVPADVFKVWNSVFLGDPCQHVAFRHAPGQLFVYDPADGIGSPPYRYPPDATLPDGLVTNQIGWRGRPIEVPRRAKSVRIVFVGSSTVVDAHNYPFSHSDFVGHWLNLWAASRGWDVRFEVLNAARDSLGSGDIAAVVHKEVLPLRPDLVLYYEGGNQFDLASIVDKMPEGSAPRTERKAVPRWREVASGYSALMRRAEVALSLVAKNWQGREAPKPHYNVVWPAGLDEFDPDLSYPRLPVNLNVIESDLDRIRNDLSSIGADFALSSFIWMVKDGMVLDPVRGRFTLEQLNVQRYPFRYRDLERLANFQNRVFAKYAASHAMPFVDVARYMPFDPDLFTDAVHFSYGGTRLRGWIILQQLLPVIEKHLTGRSWPRTEPDKAASPLPTFVARSITFDCSQPAPYRAK